MDYHYDYDTIGEYNSYGSFSRSFQRVNTFLQFISIFINLFHLFILSRKQMRSSPVNILMIGICTSDIIFTWFVFYESALEMSWIPLPISRFIDRFDSPTLVAHCTSMDFIEQRVSQIIRMAVREICRLTSIYLSVLMAVYRTLSVLFPMSSWIQKVSTAKSAVLTVFGTIFVWFVYSTEHYARLQWINRSEYKLCIIPLVVSNSTFILSLPNDGVVPLSEKSLITGLTKAIPAVLYPIITIFLIIELRKIRIRRKKLQGQSSDNTTKLVFFMTLSFMFSEGFGGAINLLSNYFAIAAAEHINAGYILVYINMFNYPVLILKTLNSMSHCFICILMSSGYRDTVAGFLCVFKKIKVNDKVVIRSDQMKVQVIMVQEASSTGSLKGKKSW